MRRRRSPRFWAILGVAAVVVVAAALVALPELLRWLAVRQLAAATGRTTTIADVDLNLFTGRLAVERLAVGDGDDRLARFDRLEARLRVLPLLAARLEIAEAILTGPEVRIVQHRPVPAAAVPGPREAPGGPVGLPFHLVIDRFEIAGGRLTFEDRRLTPAATWTAENLALAVRDLATRDPAGPGQATAAFTLAGAEVAVEVEPLHLAPPRTRAVIRVAGLPLESFLAYLPADLWARPAGGRLTAALTAEYGADGAARADPDAKLHDLVVRRGDQAEPFVSAPAVAVTLRDLALRDGRLALGRAELSAEPTVLDGSTSPPQHFTLRELRLALTDAPSPAEQPALVDLTAVLAEGDRLDSHGTDRRGERRAAGASSSGQRSSIVCRISPPARTSHASNSSRVAEPCLRVIQLSPPRTRGSMRARRASGWDGLATHTISSSTTGPTTRSALASGMPTKPRSRAFRTMSCSMRWEFVDRVVELHVRKPPVQPAQ